MQDAERFAASLTEDGRYRLLVDAIADYAVYMLDRNGIVSSWNTGARRFKGYEADEILGQHFSKFYVDEDRESGLPQRALKQAETAGKFESEGWRVRKDGTRFWAYVVIDPIHDPHGNLIGFAKITRDLTERKQAETALEKARAALAHSQKMEALGRLTGGVAHDFNNLLMVVLGSLELLRKRLLGDEKLLALVDNAVQGAQRGASLTQRMLAFARRQQLSIELLDVRAMVFGMSDMLQRAMGPEVLIETRFPTRLAPVRTDVNQLETALLNLVVNARDAMADVRPQGGPVIITAREDHATPASGLPPGRYVCLSVEDKGCGMDANTLSHAMEPFFTTKGVGKGTGLGLSMAQGLAQQSGGQLFLKSVPGEGTIAELWFPAVVASPKDIPPAETMLPQARHADARPLNVLMVDDDALVLTNSIAMLEDLGHSVMGVDSGAQALTLLRGGAVFDLVVTDHAMPSMTGAELVATIRDEWPALPVILATGYAELPEGFVDSLATLHKPFSQAQAASAIASAVKP